MSSFTTPKADKVVTMTPHPGANLEYLEANGRQPPVELTWFPLDNLQNQTSIAKFISYSFKSSIMSPVDEFSCQIHYDPLGGFSRPQAGDIFALRANGQPICTGIIDQTEVETDASQGTTLNITGRNFLGQWEDQDAVSLDTKPFFSNKATVDVVVQTLCQDTRIDPRSLKKSLAPRLSYLFATQPGESKLSAMQRYCEALDIYFWSLGDGTLTVGRPDMYGTKNGSSGTLSMSKSSRRSNVLTIRSMRSPTQIPNIMVPIWNGQESVQHTTDPSKIIYNNSPGPDRLRRLGHRVPKAVVVSTPDGSAPQDLAELNTLLVALASSQSQKTSQAGSSTVLQAYALREMAKANMRDLQVQIQMLGHYNDELVPYMPDQVYRIQYDLDNVDEDMYLYEVEYVFDEKGSQRSRLFFCRQTSIVANSRVFKAK